MQDSTGADAVGPDRTGTAPTRIEVELDAFSGRPNPTWTLTPAQAAILTEMVRKLPELTERHVPYSGLGYRGFIVRGCEGWGPIHAGYGAVWTPHGRVAQRLDSERKVEAFLLDTARSHVDSGVLAIVEQAIREARRGG